MAGCFGNSISDRSMEQQLNAYLNNEYCTNLKCTNVECNFDAVLDEWEREYNVPDNPQTVDEDEEVIITPNKYIDNIKKYILSIDRLY